MSFFNILSILLTISALFSYINYRYVKLPSSIGLMFIALLMSLALIGLSRLGIPLQKSGDALLQSIDLNEFFLHGMLSFMLFAGALHVDLHELAGEKWVIGWLATGSVLTSTIIVGVLLYFIFSFLGSPLPLMDALLFGALISPTDPIAVLGILQSTGTSKRLEVKISGESLFNDGIGVVVFVILLETAVGKEAVTISRVVSLFLQEAVGGALFGLAIGLIAYRMLKQVDNYNVEILITLGLVAGGYALADQLHVSGPIAIVVAGLLIGNHGRSFAMSDKTREHLDTFWELTDEVLNAVLFVLIGLEVMVLPFTRRYLIAGMVAVPVVLLARFVSVGVPISLMRLFQDFTPHAVKILTWGGLRGGISIALALSLPSSSPRDAIVSVTYAVAVFSILVQGLTIGHLAKRWAPR